MIVISAILALAALCWALFHLATFALPIAIGILVSILAYQSGSGMVGVGVVGLGIGVVTLAVGQFVFTSTRSPGLRAVIALVFSVPAAATGYALLRGIAATGGADQSCYFGRSRRDHHGRGRSREADRSRTGGHGRSVVADVACTARDLPRNERTVNMRVLAVKCAGEHAVAKMHVRDPDARASPLRLARGTQSIARPQSRVEKRGRTSTRLPRASWLSL